jgi:hypothetical protein
MNTQEFLSKLETLPNQALIFDYGDGQVKPGYHVTEVMNVTYESMDCGGQANFWRETIVQLMGPGIKDKAEYMSTQKFLNIYKKVAASVPVRGESEIRFEYGDARHPAIHYHLGDIRQAADAITVYLTQPGVTCKASDRGTCQPSAAASDARCCTPANTTSSNVALVTSGPQPSGGCC